MSYREIAPEARKLLVLFKTQLVQYMDEHTAEELEYFISVLEYVLSGQIRFTDTVYRTLYEELCVMLTVDEYKTSEFLKIFASYQNLQKILERDIEYVG